MQVLALASSSTLNPRFHHPVYIDSFAAIALEITQVDELFMDDAQCTGCGSCYIVFVYKSCTSGHGSRGRLLNLYVGLPGIYGDEPRYEVFYSRQHNCQSLDVGLFYMYSSIMSKSRSGRCRGGHLLQTNVKSCLISLTQCLWYHQIYHTTRPHYHHYRGLL